MSKDIALYMEFCELRERIIDDIKKIAVISEEKNGGIVRPIGVIKSIDEYLEFEKKLAQWRQMANKLNQINPVRYPANAEKFALMPQIYLGVEYYNATISPATLSRKYEKTKIVARMERYLESLTEDSKITGDWELTNRVKNELDAMNSDKETYYRLRNTCSTEMICYAYYENGIFEKIKVQFCGILIFNDKNEIKLKQLRKQSKRTDSFEHLGVSPIPCSLSMIGHLYRETELTKARARFAQQKHAGI